MDILINLRKRHELTLKQLKDELNKISGLSFDEKRLWQFEKGEKTPTEIEAEVLGHYFNLPYEEFIYFN